MRPGRRLEQRAQLRIVPGLIGVEDIEAIGRWAVERGLWVLTDEIYEHLVYGDAELGKPTGDLTGGQQILGPGDDFPFALGWTLGRAIPHRRAVREPPPVRGQCGNDRVTLLGWHPDGSPRVLDGKGLLESEGYRTRPTLAAVLLAGVGSRRRSQSLKGTLPPWWCSHDAPMASSRRPLIAGPLHGQS